MKKFELWHGDCLELMKNIPDGSVDLVLCDLPYDVTDFSWDVIIPCDKLFAEYRYHYEKQIQFRGFSMAVSLQVFHFLRVSCSISNHT